MYTEWMDGGPNMTSTNLLLPLTPQSSKKEFMETHNAHPSYHWQHLWSPKGRWALCSRPHWHQNIAKTEWLFWPSSAVVILVAVLSDTKEDKSLSFLVIEDKLRKIKPGHYNRRQFPVRSSYKTGMFEHTDLSSTMNPLIISCKVIRRFYRKKKHVGMAVVQKQV